MRKCKSVFPWRTVYQKFRCYTTLTPPIVSDPRLLRKLEEAVDVFNARRPDFAIELGDLKDNSNGHDETIRRLEEIEAAFARFKGPRYHVSGGGEKSAGGERGSARDGGGAGPCVQQLRRRRNLAFGRVHGDGMAQRADRAANRAGTGARHGLTPWDRPRRSTPFTSAARSAGSRHRPPGRTPSCARAAPCWAGGASASGVPGGR